MSGTGLSVPNHNSDGVTAMNLELSHTLSIEWDYQALVYGKSTARHVPHRRGLGLYLCIAGVRATGVDFVTRTPLPTEPPKCILPLSYPECKPAPAPLLTRDNYLIPAQLATRPNLLMHRAVSTGR